MEIPSSARFLKSGFGSSSLKDYTEIKGTVRLSAYLIDKRKEKKRKRGDILINLE